MKVAHIYISIYCVYMKSTGFDCIKKFDARVETGSFFILFSFGCYVLHYDHFMSDIV